MEAIIIILLVVIIIIFFLKYKDTSNDYNSNEVNSPDLKNKIIGKWYVPDGDDIDTVEFFNNNTYIFPHFWGNNEKEEGRYEIHMVSEEYNIDFYIKDIYGQYVISYTDIILSTIEEIENGTMKLIHGHGRYRLTYKRL